jgi:hypothetical protein
MAWTDQDSRPQEPIGIGGDACLRALARLLGRAAARQAAMERSAPAAQQLLQEDLDDRLPSQQVAPSHDDRRCR